MEEHTAVALEMVIELLNRMGMEGAVESFTKEGNICVEISGDAEGILIGKHGRTLEALQMLVNRMVNKRLIESVRVVIDVDHYRVRRANSLAKMVIRVGERAKRVGKPITIGPFNAHDRRIIHITLKEDPLLRTESQGDGAIKKVAIIPEKREGERVGLLE